MKALATPARFMFHAGLALALVGVLSFSALTGSPVSAAPTTSSLTVYLDQPFVQGTYVASGTVVTEDFNAGYPAATVPCPSSIAVGTVAGTCQVEDWGDFGGASVGANVSTQTVGGGNPPPDPAPDGVGRYASTSGTMTISFTEDQRYLGLWWTAGSVGNSLKFFKDNTLLLTVTTETIMTLLGQAPGWQNNGDWVSLNNDSANVISSIGPNPSSYPKVWYFGNPRGYTSNPPTAISSLRSNEPFVYLHMFAGGNLTFNKIELAAINGSGFEFDNLAVSTTAQTPDPRLVLVSQFTSSQYAVRFEPNGASVEGSMPNQVGTTPAALNANTYTRSGFTFAGWATEEGGGGTRFADGASYDFAADLTLYARWIADPAPRSRPAAVDTPPHTEVGESLAATGSSTPGLMGLSVLATLVGFLLIALSRVWRLKQRVTARI
jgi:uncharacterized repeat protein (TIGR02543 family)